MGVGQTLDALKAVAKNDPEKRAALLATRDIFHPEMVDVVLIGPGWDWVDLNHTVLIVIVLAFVLWDTVDVYRRALRSRTDAPTRTAVPTS